MVVNYSPAGFRLLEDEGEAAVRFISAAFKEPTTKYDRTVFAQESYLEIRELQLTHLLARVVTPLITLEHSVPAAIHVIA